MSDFEQCSNPLQLDLNYDFMRIGDFVECLNGLEFNLISLFHNCSCKLATIMLRYDFPEMKWDWIWEIIFQLYQMSH